VVALLTTLGWFSRLPAELLRLSHPEQVGNFATGIFIGALLQLIALLVTDVAGLAATVQNYRSTSHGEGGLVKTVCKVLGGFFVSLRQRVASAQVLLGPTSLCRRDTLFGGFCCRTPRSPTDQLDYREGDDPGYPGGGCLTVNPEWTPDR